MLIHNIYVCINFFKKIANIRKTVHLNFIRKTLGF